MTTPNRYDKGQLVVCTGEFRDQATNTPTDPTTPLFAYRDGGETWHRDLEPVRTGAGVYTYSVDTSTPDTRNPQETWFYQFYSPNGDSLQAAEQFTFYVINTGRF